VGGLVGREKTAECVVIKGGGGMAGREHRRKIRAGEERGGLSNKQLVFLPR
jgi:hypothetical protein